MAGGGRLPVDDSSSWTAPGFKPQTISPFVALANSEKETSNCNKEAGKYDECVGVERDQDSVSYARWRRSCGSDHDD